MGLLPKNMPIADFAKYVGDKLGSNGVRYNQRLVEFKDMGQRAHRVAVGGGSCAACMDAVRAAGCDTLVTSDVNYHQFMSASAVEFNLVDAGHFPTENVVIEKIASFLEEKYPSLYVVRSKQKEMIQYYVK